MNNSAYNMQGVDKMNQSSGRNSAIEALRFLSIFQICL